MGKVRRPTPVNRGAFREIRTPQQPKHGRLNPPDQFRLHPFASKRFHVLLNSLFKVLFNFPSRYLSAIGLVPVFSLRWSLPPALGCIPKQPDSKDTSEHRTASPYGPYTLSGPEPQSSGLGASGTNAKSDLNTTVLGVQRREIRRWAIPRSVALTEGILVSFFSSA